jgi:nucleoid-associated protein EbfC
MAGFDPKQFQEIIEQAQRQAQDLQAQMQNTIVEASSGGGTVTVKMNGQKRVLAVKIDPEAMKSGDVEMLQDLVTAAVNEAGRKVDAAMQASVGGMLGGMGIPGISQ